MAHHRLGSWAGSTWGKNAVKQNKDDPKREDDLTLKSACIALNKHNEDIKSEKIIWDHTWVVGLTSWMPLKANHHPPSKESEDDLPKFFSIPAKNCKGSL